jgi:hypothetical protein
VCNSYLCDINILHLQKIKKNVSGDKKKNTGSMDLDILILIIIHTNFVVKIQVCIILLS